VNFSRRAGLGLAKIICVNLFFLEVGAFFSLLYLQEKGVVYYPPRILPQEYAEYVQIKDAALGWPAPSKDTTETHPGQPPPCVSLYGDSFTYNGEVPYPYSWSNVLSRLLRCRVANFGAAGYGTDQAYLRFHNNTKDASKIAILGFTSENILRNINQYRPLLYYNNLGAGKFGVKPRFILDHSGRLQLVPLPQFTYEEFLEMTRFPQRYLRYEYFLPGGPSGIAKREFPYALTLVKVLTRNFHIRTKLTGVPWYQEFYGPDHPSGALPLTFGILSAFYLEAKQMQRIPVIVTIPTGLDLAYYTRYKKWPYENLTRMLEAAGIGFLDAGPKIIEHLKGRDPKELFDDYHSHFNTQGEKALAGIVYEYLKENNIPGLSYASE